MIQFRDRGAPGGHQGRRIDARHSFSFADYNDPKHMGFRAFRVLNEDRIVPGARLPEHLHADIEKSDMPRTNWEASKSAFRNDGRQAVNAALLPSA